MDTDIKYNNMEAYRKSKKIFWIDGFEGKTEGVYPLRNDLVNFMERIELHADEEVVGIVYDGSYNLEILTKKTDGETE